jgi:hypothetical protein
MFSLITDGILIVIAYELYRILQFVKYTPELKQKFAVILHGNNKPVGIGHNIGG